MAWQLHAPCTILSYIKVCVSSIAYGLHDMIFLYVDQVYPSSNIVHAYPPPLPSPSLLPFLSLSLFLSLMSLFLFPFVCMRERERETERGGSPIQMDETLDKSVELRTTK